MSRCEYTKNQKKVPDLLLFCIFTVQRTFASLFFFKSRVHVTIMKPFWRTGACADLEGKRGISRPASFRKLKFTKFTQ